MWLYINAKIQQQQRQCLAISTTYLTKQLSRHTGMVNSPKDPRKDQRYTAQL